ncbi:hypothetical protein QVD17_17162 [Tagetes erecta]|uniref:Uncharacterized protein n=1 Tax=Tagetes erecta TaxID=13708 RepID=A0AAD8P172_TARER|nr:hypothetical protein QVD17_17162 [Tagetes erecta]
MAPPALLRLSIDLAIIAASCYALHFVTVDANFCNQKIIVKSLALPWFLMVIVLLITGLDGTINGSMGVGCIVIHNAVGDFLDLLSSQTPRFNSMPI